MFTWYRTADRIALLFSIVIHVFNVQTINCMQYSEPVVIETRRNLAMK